MDSSTEPGGNDDAGRCETQRQTTPVLHVSPTFRSQTARIVFFHSLAEACKTVLEYFGCKLVVRKHQLFIFGGEKAARVAKAWVCFFSITNAIYFSFIGILHNCNPENEAAAGKDIRTQIKITGDNNILYNSPMAVKRSNVSMPKPR